MATLFTLAFRNLLRHKRRLLLTAMTIGAGVALFIFVDSLLTGMDSLMLANTKALTDTALKVQTRAYADEAEGYPLDYFIPDEDAVRRALLDVERVTAVTKRTRFIGEIIKDGRDALPIMGVVIDPALDPLVFKVNDYIEDGAPLDDSTEYALLIGSTLARDFGVAVGDTLDLAVTDANDAQNAIEFSIVGIFNTPDPLLNLSTAYLTYASGNDLLGIEGAATELSADIPWAKGTPYERYRETLDRAKASLALDENEYAVKTLHDAVADFLAIAGTKQSVTFLMYFTILVIAMVGVLNTVLMSVYERIREIGVFRSMGFTAREIVTMFVIEGGLIGCVGAVFGVALGALANIALVTVGMDVEAFGVDGAALGMPVQIYYGQWNLATFVGIAIFSVVVSLIASYLPARRGAKITVIEAMRFQ